MLQSTGSRVLRFSNCEAPAQLPRGTWSPPGPEMEPAFPVLQGRLNHWPTREAPRLVSLEGEKGPMRLSPSLCPPPSRKHSLPYSPHAQLYKVALQLPVHLPSVCELSALLSTDSQHCHLTSGGPCGSAWVPLPAPWPGNSPGIKPGQS